jgi:hypothetical protein
MSLAIDSLVTDLIFEARGNLDQKALIDALGGPEAAKEKKLLDPDMLDPRLEMELSPSMPFRRRGERRLMIIDDSQGQLRADPRTDPVIPIDLRGHKEALIAMCGKLPVRLGRLFALGSWGDAVLVARNARDLRGIALIAWALDPGIDVDGKPAPGGQLSKQQFEAKILAYEKRLEELDEQEILASLGGATFERRGDLLVVDVLEADGTWDQRKSLLLENQLAAIDRFSLIPGAPAQKKVVEARPAARPEPKKEAPAPAPAAPEKAGPPLAIAEVGGAVLLVFPAERFDLDVAAALGKRDWDQIVRRSDQIPGATRDRIQRDGAAWVAPLEFLSEVFVEGKPLSKPAFEQAARSIDGGVRALEVHFPRFGPAVLLEVPGKGRFVTSAVDAAPAVAALLQR